ncbi:MAG: DUF1343 domain-containing protein [Chlamydiae bacterium]|nr:DUF1343 domain-containing protein [Chlamydiota bacterium]
MHKLLLIMILVFVSPLVLSKEKVETGADLFFKEGYAAKYKGKRIGLVTNQTGIDADFHPTYELFLNNKEGMKLVAIFSPEHGFRGEVLAEKQCEDIADFKGIPVYSLYGKTRRPTIKMLENVDLIVYDIQDIGCRSYTFISTLFYVMEEAAKKNIPVMVFDRPNPMGGRMVDGPMLEEKWRSFIGYINVPYCHGMTVGELAAYFNKEYKVGCSLIVIPMKGWKRDMSFQATGLPWIPTSVYIPESNTPYFYSSSGIIGSLSVVSIGIGYPLPFKVIGAPWMNANAFAASLNKQKLSGVKFVPYYFTPQYGLFKSKPCEGVYLVITNKNTFRPVTTQFLILGMLKSMYPQEMNAALQNLGPIAKELFCKACGSEEILKILTENKYAAWKLIQYQKHEREIFIEKRKKYLLY